MSGPVIGEDGRARCPWGARPGVMQDYHDTEWGVPVVGEAAVFERLTLEAFQSGLSWSTILNKRPAFRKAFDDFDADRITSYDDRDVARLMADAGIVRNRRKIEATIVNAGAVVALRSDGGLEEHILRFAPDRQPEPETTTQVPTTSAESLALSKHLKRLGLTFVGPTTMHALMEATGIVNTHLVGCHRRSSVSAASDS